VIVMSPFSAPDRRHPRVYARLANWLADRWERSLPPGSYPSLPWRLRWRADKWYWALKVLDAWPIVGEPRHARLPLDVDPKGRW
jgi:hypothetical protein